MGPSKVLFISETEGSTAEASQTREGGYTCF